MVNNVHKKRTMNKERINNPMSEKTVLITGSSRGLGKSLALVFAENRYNVILHGRDEQALKKVQESVLENNVECDVVIGDITTGETISRLSEIAERRNFDILINNAGLYVKEPFPDMSLEDFRRIIEVNLIAPVCLTHKVFPIFQRKKSGLIININSIAGKNASDGESAYCASKHGLKGFTRSLSFDATRSGIRVIDVYLGAMNTGMTKGRKEPEKCIKTSEAADLIFRICKDYRSMRINEINLSRRRY